MKFSTREDIEAPLDFVFNTFADVEGWERAAMRRGAEVSRTDKLHTVAVGMGWQVAFDYRGKARNLTISLTGIDRPNALAFAGNAQALDGVVTLEFVEMSARRTRVSVAAELKPRTFGARLFLQSMKLAKARITRRYQQRVAHICSDIEDRYRAGTRR
ncbi:MAG TPA: SRPBCC family protein [Paracoccaceae bacterium]